ncbi:18314_t:CDS:2 [Entrophospora sp. SA101]|nr:18314_t:CDS:2 [Entrophospora sp. SA101]CAJ0850232.1 98_t:CDS:2 [Entrophospora sp. SA101]
MDTHVEILSQKNDFKNDDNNIDDDYSNNEDNIDPTQKNNKDALFSDTSDSEIEFINHNSVQRQGDETEPEDKAKNLEARETLQHEKLIKADMHDVHAVTEVNLKNKQNVFGIVTPKRTYYVQAESKKMLDEWVEAINKVKKEVQDEELLDEGSQADKGPHSYVSASSYTSGGSVPNASSSPSSPFATNSPPKRQNSSDRTASSEEENDVMDVTNDENDENNEGDEKSRIIHQGYLYKLDRYKVFKISMHDLKPHLSINLIDVLDAIEIEPISKSKLYCFKVITPRRTYVCCAPNDETQVAWLAAIQSFYV